MLGSGRTSCIFGTLSNIFSYLAWLYLDVGISHRIAITLVYFMFYYVLSMGLQSTYMYVSLNVGLAIPLTHLHVHPYLGFRARVVMVNGFL